jgi:hypothetical protein
MSISFVAARQHSGSQRKEDFSPINAVKLFKLDEEPRVEGRGTSAGKKSVQSTTGAEV